MKPPLYVIFISGWGSEQKAKDNLFLSGEAFLEQIISSFPISMLASHTKESSFIDIYKTLGAAMSPEQSLGAFLAAAGIKQQKIAGPDRYGLLTDIFNASETVFEKETRIYIEYPHGPSLQDTPELEVSSVMKELDKSFVHKRDTVVFACISQIWALAQYKDPELLKTGIQYLSKALQQFVDKAIHEGARVLLVSDSSVAEAYNSAFSEDAVRTEAPLPCVLIHPSVEGLRAADHDYATGQATHLSTAGTLEDVAPTIVRLMGLGQPDWMSGNPLFSDFIERTL